MNPTSNNFMFRVFFVLVMLLLTNFCVDVVLAQTTVTKDNNSNALNLNTSWTGGNAPNSGSIASWDSTSGSGTWSLGGNLSWGKISFSNVTGDGTISGNNTLTLSAISGAGIDMSSASANLTITGGTVTLGAAQTWNVGSGRTLSVGSNISGSGIDLIKGGAGTLSLSGANTTRNLKVAGTGVLQITGGTTAIGARGGSTTFGATAGDTVSVLINGGTLSMSDGGTYSYITFGDNGGTANITVANGTYRDTTQWGMVLARNNGSTTLGTSSAALTINSGGLVYVNGANLNGINIAEAGTGTVNLNTGGILQVYKVWKSANGIGNFYFDGGTLKPVANNATFMTGLTGAYVKDGGAIIDTSTFTISVGQSLLTAGTGIGGLTKNGTGKLTLTGGNTYTGQTVINDGTLALTGSGTLGSSSGINLAASTSILDVSANGFTVGSGKTISGIGQVVGNLAVASNATLTPGNSVGIFKTGNLSLTGTLDNELGRNAGTPESDVVQVTGTVTLNSGANLKLTLGSGLTTPQVGDIFYLVNNDVSDTITGAFTQLNGVNKTLSEGSTFGWSSLDWQITYQANFGTAFTGGNDIAIQVTAIPEPSTWVLVSLAIVPLFLRRRK